MHELHLYPSASPAGAHQCPVVQHEYGVDRIAWMLGDRNAATREIGEIPYDKVTVVTLVCQLEILVISHYRTNTYTFCRRQEPPVGEKDNTPGTRQ